MHCFQALNFALNPDELLSAHNCTSGLGVLVVRKEAAEVLHKVYFGGGAVDDATAEVRW